MGDPLRSAEAIASAAYISLRNCGIADHPAWSCEHLDLTWKAIGAAPMSPGYKSLELQASCHVHARLLVLARSELDFTYIRVSTLRYTCLTPSESKALYLSSDCEEGYYKGPWQHIQYVGRHWPQRLCRSAPSLDSSQSYPNCKP
jgi:hypothetical protein